MRKVGSAQEGNAHEHTCSSVCVRNRVCSRTRPAVRMCGRVKAVGSVLSTAVDISCAVMEALYPSCCRQ